nr:SpoIID/LytB domain-containing protein [Bacillota bacterium]
VFRGLYGQSPNQDIVKAVQETAGEVLFSLGTMVRTASFHSSCGGWTESSEDVWGSKFAHLSNVGCRLDAGPMPNLRDEATLRKYIEEGNKKDLCYGGIGYRWKASVEVKAIEAELARMVLDGVASATDEIPLQGPPRVTKRSARGAALELRMSSSTAEYIIKGELNIRKLLGGSTIIKSGVFVILPVSVEGRLDIIGAGYGHGVGMCQDGAKALAKLGKDYRAILSFYYRGGSVAKVY